MGIIAHIVDSTIASNSSDFSRNSSVAAGDIVVKIGASCNGICQALSDVYMQASDGSLDQLLIHGHGAAGIQNVAAGKDGKYSAAELSALTVSVLDDDSVKAEFFKLRSKFSGQGEIVLLGCHTGEDEAGAELIKKLAKISGVAVISSNTYQIVGYSDLVGTIRRASPDGSISENKIQGVVNYFGNRTIFEQAILAGAELWHTVTK